MAAVNPLAQAAQDRFIAQHFENEPNLVTRRAAMAAAEAGAVGLPNATLAKNAKPIYRQLLTDAMRAIDRFNLDNFGAEPNLVTRHGAIQAAIANAGAHGLSPFGLQQYQALLGAALAAPALDPIRDAIARYNGHNFAAQPDLALRYGAIQAAIADVGVSVVIADATERGHYQALLNAALLDPALANVHAAVVRFNAFNFGAEANLVTRHGAIQAAIADVGVGVVIADATERGHYQALLNAVSAPLNAAVNRFNAHNFAAIGDARNAYLAIEAAIADIGVGVVIADATERGHYQALLNAALLDAAFDPIRAAIARYNAHNFGAEANLVTRHGAIQAARGAVAGLALGAVEQAHYQALLDAEFGPLDAAVGRYNGHNFGAEANLVTRHGAIQAAIADVGVGVVIADATERGHYQALLNAVFGPLDAAVVRFNAFNFGAEANLVTRHGAIQAAIADVGVGVVIADATERGHYQALLNAEFGPLDAAVVRFNAFNFGAQANLVTRHGAIQAAIADVGVGVVIADVTERGHYQALLNAEFGPLDAAVGRYNGHNFGAQANLVTRHGAIQAAIADVGVGVVIASATERGHYQALLNAVFGPLNAAVVRYNAHNFGAQANLVARHGAIQAAIADIGAGVVIADVTERGHYQALLNAALLDPALANVHAAVVRFNAFNFGAEANLVTRHGAIQAAIADVGVGVVIADVTERGHYQALLNAEFGPLDAAVGRYNGHNFGAQANLVTRHGAIQAAIADVGVGVVIASATERGHYQALLNAEFGPLDAAVGRYNGHNFGAQANLVARHGAIQAAIGGVGALGLAAGEQAHYLALLNAEFGPLDAAVNRYNAHNFAAQPDLGLRYGAIEAAIADIGVGVVIADATERGHYQTILNAALASPAFGAIRAAILRFNAHNFGAEVNLVTRHGAIHAAIGGVGALGLGIAQAAHYQALLNAEFGPLDAAVVRFNAFNFGAEANLVTRHGAIQAAIADVGVGVVIANATERGHYQALLNAEFGSLDAAVVRFNGHNFGAQLDLALRYGAIEAAIADIGAGVVIADATERGHYQALLNAALLDPALANIHAAVVRFNAFNFGAEANLVTRHGAIQAAIADVGVGVVIVDAMERGHYQALLNAEFSPLDAAVVRFNGHNFGAAANLVTCHGAIQAAIADVGVGVVIVDAMERGHYQALLNAEFGPLDAAVVRFNGHNFGAEANLVTRHGAIQAAIADVGVGVVIADATERGYYQALLNAEFGPLDAAVNRYNAHNFAAAANVRNRYLAIEVAIAGVAALGLVADEQAHYQALLNGALAAPAFNPIRAAIARFNAHNFAAQADLVARHGAMQAARLGVAALGLGGLERGHYQALLNAEFGPLDAAVGRFNAHNFGAEANLVTRRGAIQAAIGGVGALGLGAAEQAHYQALLDAEFGPLDAAVGRFNAHNFGAEANLVTRRGAIQAAIADVGVGVVIADATERGHYQALLNAEFGPLDAAVVRFNAFNFGAEANLVTRRGAIQAAIADVGVGVVIADATERGHYQALLNAEFGPLDAAVVRFNAFNFGAEANLVTRRGAIQAAIADVGVGVVIADATERGHYQALLNAEFGSLDAAVGRYNAHNFAAQPDLVARHGAIQAAIADVGVGVVIADAVERGHYQALLNAEFGPLDAAVGRFNGHNFGVEANLVTRHGAIQAARAGVGALGLGAAEQAHYQALLNAEFGPLDAAVTRFNLNNFAAEPDLEQRRDDIDAVRIAAVVGLAPQAEALYRSLLDTTHTALDQAITAFENHHFDNEPNLVTRHGQVQAAIANAAAQVLNPEALVHYRALLAKEFTPLNAALVRFNGRNFDQFGNLVDRRTQIAAAIAGIGGLGLTPVEEGHYQTLLEAKAKETSVALGTQRFAAHQFEKTTNVRDRLTSVREAISKAPGVVYVDHTGDEQASYTASLKGVETYLVAAVRRCDAHKFREQANFATRRTVIDAAIAKISTLPLLPGEEPCYRALLAVERTLASNGVAQERFNAHRFSETRDLSARLQLFEQAIQKVGTLGISDAAEKTHYLALLTSNRQTTVTALSQVVTQQAAANVSAASNLVQERTAIAEQLARVQSQFPVGSAEGRLVQQQLQARSPSSTMVVQQTAQRMAQAMKSGSPTGQQQLVQDVKQLSDEERRKAAALAARTAWGK